MSGLRFSYDSRKPVGEKVQTAEVKEDGVTYVPLDLNKIYVVATNTFTAKGGDGYTVFAKAYSELRSSATTGEQLFFRTLKTYLPDDYIVYFEPEIQGRRPE